MMNSRRLLQISICFLSFLLLLLLHVVSSSQISSHSPPLIHHNLQHLLLPHDPDALALLSFKSKADLSNTLRFPPPIPISKNFSHCQWQGVQCQTPHGKIIRLVLKGVNLGGIFGPDTLTRLDQLRVLSLQHNSLTGPIPDLSGLFNLKALFLDHNYFTSSIPPSISSLHRLRHLDFSHNNLTGPILPQLNNLDRLNYLRLDSNRFNGSIPPLNQSSLRVFNVSHNNLFGPIPVTPALIRFGRSSYAFNTGLCGEIVRKECRSTLPFFRNSTSAPPAPAVLGQLDGVELAQPNGDSHKRTAAIIGFSTGALVLISSIVCFAMAVRKQTQQKDLSLILATDFSAAADAAAVIRMEEVNELEEKVRKLQQGVETGRSGSLVFCAGEAQLYSLEQLMTASAELLGRGTLGTTYKAVLDNRLIVCVKRLDALKLAGTGKEAFERHIDAVGGLRHPNLVPLRAYFQAKEERLLVYDYQPNGSLFSLIHGSKSTRAKPLHWTSCLKIAEDLAQGLAYIHQAWRLVHGNLKSSNVLLGPDFEACLTDYCLSILADISEQDDIDSATYKAPETHNLSQPETAKSDAYSYGILLLELLTGKPPSQHPHLMTDDIVKWVKSMRDEEGCGEEDNRMEMLLQVAIACRATSPEQRPTMWQVLKMIQEIKDAIVTEDYELDPQFTATS